MVKILTANEQITGIENVPSHLCSLKKEKLNAFKELKNKLIKEIAKKSLIELAVSLAFAGIACLFVATPVGMATLLISAVAAVAINILLRSANAYCRYRFSQLEHVNTSIALEKKQLLQTGINILNYLAPVTFSSLVDSQTRALIVHEGGHALAAGLLVKNPRFQININPFNGAQISYRLGALTKLGEFFGRANTKLIVAGAGPALAVATATIGYGASLVLNKSNPELSRYLNMIAVDVLVAHVLYALSALWTSTTQKSHDFIQLMAGGVHPVAAAISIIALPLIVRIGFFVYDKVKAKAAEKIAAREAIHHGKPYMIQLPTKAEAMLNYHALVV